jgi:hypothetical protein
MFIWCDFFLDDFDSGRYLKLTSDIDPSYLVENPKQIRDPQIEQNSIEIKLKYENKLTKSFNEMKQGDEVDVYGLTFFCPKNNEPHSGSVSTLYFNRLEYLEDGSIASIILNNKPFDEGSC